MLETLDIPLELPDAPLRMRAQLLWDELADHTASRIDAALDGLMHGLCALADAQNAAWAGFVRLDSAGNDPIDGWRPLAMRFLHPDEKLLVAVRAQARGMNRRFPNVAVAGIAAQAGDFRAGRLRDIAPEAWFDSDFYRIHYDDCDRADAIYVAFPVNADAESWFGVFRARGQPRFGAGDRDAVAYALRGIKWFHRQLMLSHGLLVAGMPLTEVERRVLQGLLNGLTEKRIAAEMEQSHNTVHGHVSAIYRKFGVSSRAALMALWLGKSV